MCFDNRYPWFDRVPDGPYKKVADGVCRRAKVQSAINRRGLAIVFYVGDLSRIVWTEVCLRPDGSAKQLTANDADRICRMIHWARAPAEVKEQWAKTIEEREKHAEGEASETFLENEQVPEWNKRLKYAREWRGVRRKHVKQSPAAPKRAAVSAVAGKNGGIE